MGDPQLLFDVVKGGVVKTYAVKSAFATLQGEGMWAGTRSVFVRFAGCNLWNGTLEGREHGVGACARWCDTDFGPTGARKLTAEQLIEEVLAQWGDVPGCPRVVLTGGEPFLQADTALVNLLRQVAVVAVETNGWVEPTAQVSWLCCSPKLKADGSMPELKLNGANELKVVLGGYPGWSDAQLLELQRMGVWHNLIVQPLDVRASLERSIGPAYGGGVLPMADAGLARCLDWVHRHPSWRLGVQLHKLAGIP